MDVIYSSELVPPEHPAPPARAGDTPLQRAREALAAHGLALRSVGPNTYVVVRAPAPAPAADCRRADGRSVGVREPLRDRRRSRRAARAVANRHRTRAGQSRRCAARVAFAAGHRQQRFGAAVHPRLAERRRAGALRRHRAARSVSPQEFPEPHQRHRSGGHRAHRSVQRRIPRAVRHAFRRCHRHHGAVVRDGSRISRQRQPDFRRRLDRSAKPSAGPSNGSARSGTACST